MSALARSVLIGLLAFGVLTGSAAAQQARVIVKYREGTALAGQPTLAARAHALSVMAKRPLLAGRGLGQGLELIRATGITSEALAAQLSQQGQIEYAVPDGRRYAMATTPNDPLFPASAMPTVGQWYLQDSQPAAIRANLAWDRTRGSHNVIVAVLDTGVRPDHPDLASKFIRVGGTVYGYDFVSDIGLSGDGNLRDADPSDPGDFLTQEEKDARPDLFGIDNPLTTEVEGCLITPSSWHGTAVSGIVAAATDNNIGVAGVSWNSPILAVRVLGKCGGFDSDILAGMRWAAGLETGDPSIPPNAHPARILNLSLGAPGSCNAAYIDTIREITARGVLVVAPAGNDSGAVHVPGNCPGVLTVAGLRHNGNKVGYSAFGPEVEVAAPAGNCGTSLVACEYPIVTTTDTGTQAPTAPTYSDSTVATYGTSFAVPQTSGVAALMFSLNPLLSPSDVIARVRSSARAFPPDPSVPACYYGMVPAPCNCTTAICGAGMLDAAAAMSEALRPAARIAAPSTSHPGAVLVLDGSASVAVDGSITSYQWVLTSGNGIVSAINNPNGATATVTPTGSGTFTVSLLVTDQNGQTDLATTSVVVSAPTPAPSEGGGGGGGGSLDVLTLVAMLLLAAGAVSADRAPQRRKSRQVAPMQ